MTFWVSIMAFGERLKEIRKDYGLNQREMAEKFGISLSTLQRYEKSNNFPEISVLLELALSGFNIHWLVTGDGEKFAWKAVANNQYLNEIGIWLQEEEKNEKKIREWFEVQFEMAFPKFKEWKQRKETGSGSGDHYPSSKVA